MELAGLWLKSVETSSNAVVAKTPFRGPLEALIIASFINSTFAEEKQQSKMHSGASLNFINTIFMNEIVADDTVQNISVWTNHSLFRYGQDTFDANLI